MSDLVAVGFENEMKADEVLQKLVKLEKSHLIDLEDARCANQGERGKIRIKQAYTWSRRALRLADSGGRC